MLSCCKSDIVVEKLQICVETIFCRERFECIYSPAERLPTPPTQPSTSVYNENRILFDLRQPSRIRIKINAI